METSAQLPRNLVEHALERGQLCPAARSTTFLASAFGPSERFVPTAVPAYAAVKVASGQVGEGAVA